MSVERLNVLRKRMFRLENARKIGNLTHIPLMDSYNINCMRLFISRPSVGLTGFVLRSMMYLLLEMALQHYALRVYRQKSQDFVNICNGFRQWRLVRT